MLGFHGSTGTEVRMLMGKQLPGSVRANSRRMRGCQPGVMSSTRAMRSSPRRSMTPGGYLAADAQNPQLM